MILEQTYLILAMVTAFNIALLAVLTFLSLLTKKQERFEVDINDDTLLAKPKKDKK